MNNTDTETLYPFRVTPQLRNFRTKVWKEIIDSVLDAQADDEEKIGFSMMMVKLGGCITCSADSFRAMRGCTHCASQTVRRFRGPDEELKELFLENVAEVNKYSEKKEFIVKG
ncbi:MAG: hypothetical protein JEZ00_00465 [Anaerolineaceae bacterium]|nr:hypothetical protein [Anaerolineaceae bacterium]